MNQGLNWVSLLQGIERESFWEFIPDKKVLERGHMWLEISIKALKLIMQLSCIILLAAVLTTPAAKKRKVKDSLPLQDVQAAETQLAALGYWTGPVDGVFDQASRQALIAFQKVTGRQRTGKLTEEELTALRNANRPSPRESGLVHVEVDLARQVLFMVDETGVVSHILPVSTGNNKVFMEDGHKRLAYTPRGRFTVYRKIKGWRKSPLGLLYYPCYFVQGVAIHGNSSVPVYPASHGCVRIPMFAAQEFSEMTPIGTLVIVHDGLLPATAQ
jgi:hypothetical protein